MDTRGGARVGSGQKPQRPRFPVVDGGASPLSKAPDDLPAAQQAFWNRWAKHAIEAGTLNERTVAGFELLCELHAEKLAMRDTIDRDGRTYVKVVVDGTGTEHQELKAHPLVAKHLAITNKVDALMGRFMLTAFGKPSAAPKSKPAGQNVWASVAGA